MSSKLMNVYRIRANFLFFFLCPAFPLCLQAVSQKLEGKVDNKSSTCGETAGTEEKKMA